MRSRYAPSAFDIDLTAFEAGHDIADTQYQTQPGRQNTLQPRNVVAGPRRDGDISKRALQRQAERNAPARGIQAQHLIASSPQKTKVAQRPNTVKSARPNHLHATHSAQPRKEQSRETCKERPEPTKQKSRSGSGASKSFVPWCSRRT